MRRRTVRALWVALAVVAIAAAVAAIVVLRKRAAPEAARLLPEADAYVYVNLKPLRRAGVIGESAPITREPDYEAFIRETGFEFERDLDEAAFAVHFGAPGAQTRYSEVFSGRIDTTRATRYFARTARMVERYRDLDIYNIPIEDRTVRVVLLAPDIAAVSNVDDPKIIRGMIDRYRQVARPFGGPSLLRGYYKHLPFGTLGWTITRMPATGGMTLPGGLALSFPADSVVVGSVRYTGSISLRAEAFAAGEDEARRIADQFSTYLTLFRAIGEATRLQGPDRDVQAFFDSLKVEYEGTRATISAEATPEFFKKLLSRPPATDLPGLGTEAQEQEAPAPKQRPRRGTR